ncbi:uncharacterized protein LOC130975347 [Arachis stenosperma]|uniref:uncharacterized protein LOC130975347 n=1 Tax=Arachis stenosperma TaxID=217475 RepID=UPI0025AC1089|nr:uncharacterized protein LOC130975347 [Arachis stenosperma]
MAIDEKISHQNIYENSLKGGTTKSSIFIYALIFVALFFIIVQNNKSSSSALTSFGSSTLQNAVEQNQSPKELGDDELSYMQENNTTTQEGINNNNNIDEENEDPLVVPPPDMKKAERMAWFKTQIPKLEILKSTNLSESFFNYRVLRFLDQGCSTFFFAIWLSPAKNFGEREFMTMDTLLKVHPQACLMILSRSMDSELGSRILKPLIDLGLKVEAITPDLPFLVKNTPAKSWLEAIKNGNKDPGNIPLSQNLSNLMRLAMLYKYGGAYVDTDLIFVKDMSLLRNAIGAQAVDQETKKWLRLNNAVLIFDMNHPIVLEFLREFATTFDGNKWGYNGPYMVSRVIERIEATQGYNNSSSNYYNLTILPPKAFYPVDWNKIVDFYKRPENGSELVWVENKVEELLYGGRTYALHLWNKRTRELDIEEGSVMARLFSHLCLVCNNVIRT